MTLTDDVDPRKVDDDHDLARLRILARLHDGVVPVPFLGATWLDRGAAYSRRLAFVFASFSAGLALAVVLSMFGRDFVGERRAREASGKRATGTTSSI